MLSPNYEIRSVGASQLDMIGLPTGLGFLIFGCRVLEFAMDLALEVAIFAEMAPLVESLDKLVDFPVGFYYHWCSQGLVVFSTIKLNLTFAYFIVLKTTMKERSSARLMLISGFLLSSLMP